eukprot:scaffold88906_cov30-Tisochrysis_lutea.AAC.7
MMRSFTVGESIARSKGAGSIPIGKVSTQMERREAWSKRPSLPWVTPDSPPMPSTYSGLECKG